MHEWSLNQPCLSSPPTSPGEQAGMRRRLAREDCWLCDMPAPQPKGTPDAGCHRLMPVLDGMITIDHRAEAWPQCFHSRNVALCRPPLTRLDRNVVVY
jgi:hypothetical protein